VVAVVDTNCDPSEVDYIIPGNDDALRAIRLFASKIADSVVEGAQAATDKQSAELAAGISATSEEAAIETVAAQAAPEVVAPVAVAEPVVAATSAESVEAVAEVTPEAQ
jgi:small subunit ribosomal protein S2